MNIRILIDYFPQNIGCISYIIHIIVLIQIRRKSLSKILSFSKYLLSNFVNYFLSVKIYNFDIIYSVHSLVL